MLTMENYDALNETEKAEVIMLGDFLADREEDGLIVQLYSLGKIYGEVHYDRLANKILRYRAFDDIAQLGPFLAHIRFDNL